MHASPLFRSPLAATFLLLLAAAALCAQQPQQQQPPPAPQRELKQLAPGILASAQPLFATDSLPGYRLEVRDLVLGPNQTADRVPLEGFVLMELRSGIAEVSINGRAARREAGSQWLVPRGARVAIKNLAEATVIRATVLVPR